MPYYIGVCSTVAPRVAPAPKERIESCQMRSERSLIFQRECQTCSKLANRPEARSQARRAGQLPVGVRARRLLRAWHASITFTTLRPCTEMPSTNRMHPKRAWGRSSMPFGLRTPPRMTTTASSGGMLASAAHAPNPYTASPCRAAAACGAFLRVPWRSRSLTRQRLRTLSTAVDPEQTKDTGPSGRTSR